MERYAVSRGGKENQTGGIGAFLDVETTGLGRSDEVVEFAIALFAFDLSSGSAVDNVDHYSGGAGAVVPNRPGRAGGARDYGYAIAGEAAGRGGCGVHPGAGGFSGGAQREFRRAVCDEAVSGDAGDEVPLFDERDRLVWQGICFEEASGAVAGAWGEGRTSAKGAGRRGRGGQPAWACGRGNGPAESGGAAGGEGRYIEGQGER